MGVYVYVKLHHAFPREELLRAISPYYKKSYPGEARYSLFQELNPSTMPDKIKPAVILKHKGYILIELPSVTKESINYFKVFFLH